MTRIRGFRMLVIVAALFGEFATAAAQPGPLWWFRDHRQAAEVAKDRLLPLVVVFDRSGFGCHDCRLLEAAFADAEMAKYRDRAVFVWIDASTATPGTPEAALVQRYGIQRYPTVALADPLLRDLPANTPGALKAQLDLQIWGRIAGYAGSAAAFRQQFEQLLASRRVQVVKSFDDLPEKERQTNRELDGLWKSYQDQKAAEKTTSRGRLSNDDVGGILRQLGYTPERRAAADRRDEYKIQVKSGAWQHDIRVSLSANGDGMWIRSPLGPMDPQTAPAGALAVMLAENAHADPAFFSFDRAQRKLWLNRFVVNDGVTPETLRAHIEALVRAVQKTQPYWDASHWRR